MIRYCLNCRDFNREGTRYCAKCGLELWPQLLALLERAAREQWDSLDLSNKGLKVLPSKIGNLNCLNKLSLSGNQLIELPPEIGKLTALTTLDISSNLLTTLPSEICNLINLTELIPWWNPLTALPTGIENLPHLSLTCKYDPYYRNLPPEIGLWNRFPLAVILDIKRYYIDEHPLTDLPQGVKGLPNVRLFLTSKTG